MVSKNKNRLSQSYGSALLYGRKLPFFVTASAKLSILQDQSPAPRLQEYFAFTSLNFNLWLMGTASLLDLAETEFYGVKLLF